MYRLSERPARFLYANAPTPGSRRRADGWMGSGRGAGSLAELSVDNTTVVVALRGVCDVALAPQLSRTIGAALTAGRSAIVIDLCEADDVEVTVLSALLHAHRRLSEDGGRMAICCLPGDVHEAFAASGLDDVFEIYPDRETALGAVRDLAAA